MATIYKVEIVSHWINYSEEVLKRRILEGIDVDSNEFDVKVTRK